MNFIFWIQNEMTLVISAPDVARFKTQFSIRSVFETVARAHRIGFDECLDSKDSKRYRSTFSKDFWTKPIYSSEYEITKVFFKWNSDRFDWLLAENDKFGVVCASLLQNEPNWLCKWRECCLCSNRCFAAVDLKSVKIWWCMWMSTEYISTRHYQNDQCSCKHFCFMYFFFMSMFSYTFHIFHSKFGLLPIQFLHCVNSMLFI